MKSTALLLYEKLQKRNEDPSREYGSDYLSDLSEFFNKIAKATENRLKTWSLEQIGTSALWAATYPTPFGEIPIDCIETLKVDLYVPPISPIVRKVAHYPRNMSFEGGVCLQLRADREWHPQYVKFSREYGISPD